MTRVGVGARVETGTRVGVGAQASRMALKIRCKSSLKYLGILVVAAEASVTGGFVSKSPTGWLNNLSPNSGGGEKSRGATEGATEEATEGCSRWKHLRPRIEFILVQTFF